jgi:hypothetical protein
MFIGIVKFMICSANQCILRVLESQDFDTVY